jgi:ferritin-like metal-binding protein YciE
MPTQRKPKSRPKKQSPDGSQLLTLELQQIHTAENQLMRNLPRLAKAVESDKLRDMIERRQQQGERLIEQLEDAFQEMEESPGRKKNVAAEGLLNDAREHMQEIERGPALDAVLTAALQKLEHYCIAAWGTAKALGESCELDTVVQAMEEALEEGKDYDQELTDLAESELLPALQSGEEEDEGDEDQGRKQRNGSRRSGRSERRASA